MYLDWTHPCLLDQDVLNIPWYIFVHLCKGFDFVNHHHRSVNRSYLGSRFFGEFLPAGEIWTNTSQWTKSTFYEKKSLENIKEILFNQLKHTCNWQRNTIWLALQYGQTNPSRIRREVGLPREISLFSFPLWSRHRMEEFWGQTQSWKSYSHLEQIRYPKIFTWLCREKFQVKHFHCSKSKTVMHLSCDTDPTANLAHCHSLPHALLVRKCATS